MTTETGIGMFWLLLILIVLLTVRKRSRTKEWTVYDFETGMLFKNGNFVKTLSSGKYKFSIDHEVLKVDSRPSQFSFQASSATQNKKIIDYNIIVHFKISKPEIFINKSSAPVANIVHDKVRLSIREVFSKYHFDSFYQKQSEIENAIMQDANCELEIKGIEVTRIDLILLSLN